MLLDYPCSAASWHQGHLQLAASSMLPGMLLLLQGLLLGREQGLTQLPSSAVPGASRGGRGRWWRGRGGVMTGTW